MKRLNTTPSGGGTKVYQFYETKTVCFLFDNKETINNDQLYIV